MGKGDDITLTSAEGRVVLSLLEDAVAALAATDSLALVAELEEAIELLTDKLFWWLPES